MRSKLVYTWTSFPFAFTCSVYFFAWSKWLINSTYFYCRAESATSVVIAYIILLIILIFKHPIFLEWKTRQAFVFFLIYSNVFTHIWNITYWGIVINNNLSWWPEFSWLVYKILLSLCTLIHFGLKWHVRSRLGGNSFHKRPWLVEKLTWSTTLIQLRGLCSSFI